MFFVNPIGFELQIKTNLIQLKFVLDESFTKSADDHKIS